ncbi:MAG: CDP-diacylglycerol--serine O-phosphatidyltransferase [Alphaproteobacteria bacterium]
MFRPTSPVSLKGLPFNRMVPNILTLLALCAGVTSMRYGLRGEWERAVVAILIAAILDGLDGRVARLLRGTSKFGAELDSLSDFVSFGVAPAMVLYLWTMQNAGGFGWALVLLFSVCAALRLARFNTMLEDPNPQPWTYSFFTGVPTPAGAGLVMVPMSLSFDFQNEIVRHPAFVAMFLIGVSFLEVSRVPTFSFKRVRVPHRYVLPLMVLVGILAAFLVTDPWATLSMLGLAYLASIPFSIRAFGKLRREAEAKEVAAQQTPVEAPEGLGQ